VNSCTAALHLALEALGIGSGDEVITTPLTFCSTVNVVLQTGATPVLADIGSDLNISASAIKKCITARTRAILPVHMAGLPCDMNEIWNTAEEHGLRVIEDAAHAAGALYRGTPIGGGRSDAVAFSFYATKNLTTGEGGMVTCPDPSLYDRMRVLSLHGLSRDAWRRYSREGNWYYEVCESGFKYNMSDLLSSIGIHQLRKLERMTARRTQIAHAYNRAFTAMPELEIPPDREDSRHSWHLYVLRLRLERLSIDRAQFFAQMGNRGIGCSVHFIPIPVHPYYRSVLGPSSCPETLSTYPRLLSLPLYSSMTDDDVDRVIRAVQDIVSANHRRQQVLLTANSTGVLT
jgi:dTDP-4-amino-4,6-dideoxygalactose transaminase